jgi:flagellin
MPLRINTNIPGLNAQRIMRITGRDLKLRIERLSTGLRVNHASDDAAGLSVSEGLRAEISGFSQGIRNSEHAVNLIQTAEGALNEISSMLIRMRELAVQSSSSTVNDLNRGAMNAEVTQLVNEIDRIASSTSYNNSTLLSGYGNTVNEATAVSSSLASPTTGVVGVQISAAAAGTYVFTDPSGSNEVTLGNGTVTQTINLGPRGLDTDGAGGVVATGSSMVANFDRLGLQLTLSGQKAAAGVNPATDGYRTGDLDATTLRIDTGTGGVFQVGPDAGGVNTIEASIGDMRATGSILNLGGLSVATQGSAQSGISTIDLAINRVTRARGDLGAIQNRLGFNILANGVMLENDLSSDSSIRDADIAEEVTALTRNQVLTQSGMAMFAQANLAAARTLSLL